MNTAILSLHGITKIFHKQNKAYEVLTDISASFKQGNTYAIMGVSGTGKSTLMHLLAGLDTPTSGSVSYNEHTLANMNDTQLNHFHNKNVGLLFQNPYLIRELSVIENVMVPGLIAGQSSEACKKHALALLDAVDISQKASSKPSALSGGQQQRAALARALFNKPAFLLADEATGNLDITTAETITSLLLRLQKEWHMGIIVSTHDQKVADRMEQHYTLQQGHLHSI